MADPQVQNVLNQPNNSKNANLFKHLYRLLKAGKSNSLAQKLDLDRIEEVSSFVKANTFMHENPKSDHEVNTTINYEDEQTLKLTSFQQWGIAKC